MELLLPEASRKDFGVKITEQMPHSAMIPLIAGIVGETIKGVRLCQSLTGSQNVDNQLI